MAWHDGVMTWQAELPPIKGSNSDGSAPPELPALPTGSTAWVAARQVPRGAHRSRSIYRCGEVLEGTCGGSAGLV